MHDRHPGLTEPVAGAYLEAARVCLSRHHEPPAEFSISDAGDQCECAVEWQPPDGRTVGAWANDSDATRDGAYCCCIAGLEHARTLFAVRRAETLTGADYYVGPAGSGEDDLESCLRLEVSGVSAGNRSTVMRRLVEKIQQAREGKSSLPAVAAVVGFAEKLIAIQDVPEDQ